ncbi:3-hydroxyacyl-CoA dehydrogenase family protein [Bacillus pseudomycoides]|uniref:3-hydroxyacyl-CoA dehydrogenase family protein n=1 Tax=Bacillus pseudomycoides TaxID=64104 RepID=UPI0001A161BD|nr:3-hydroxyacyl-CoA dehydrogenase NAD-binding domain-containing protein [Bacillus pseudomycoides]EEM05976.1 Beta-hydroxybutyryl-CoA dehydrogenase [Bacillus pseudomycoides]PFW89609.1 3-hydroxybutyryl-CoA dehydrogenase [Bacillus pseudomycoides]PFX45013.1 3-hydroxybutyryl-CoA dehydrogenase [Bacillus pseudomycoides]PFY87580.1 3-hydroxybutyryl-CoA dehydrogenase [Bacillus pseudomycoides]PGC33475.1 3-hydroxybutyryl-CoA dehydrogenase [Bacillus pseudomycoides]
MRKIGVVGAGVMGIGIAQNLAAKDCEVVLLDISEEILKKSREQIINNIRLQSFFKKDNYKSVDEVLKNITFTIDYDRLQDVDFVIENVTEKWGIKEKVYRKLDGICKKDVIFAANTSAISITKLASLTKRAKQVIGMHFMNPVPMKNMVEVIRGYHTSTEAINSAIELLNRMGKEGIVVEDMPGFVSNRVLMLTINEAIYLVQDNVSNARDIDRIFKGCFGHQMGPLATADLIGLDTILHSIEVLYESYNDSKYRPCPLLKKMVDAGLYGQKSGEGFYKY